MTLGDITLEAGDASLQQDADRVSERDIAEAAVLLTEAVITRWAAVKALFA